MCLAPCVVLLTGCAGGRLPASAAAARRPVPPFKQSLLVRRPLRCAGEGRAHSAIDDARNTARLAVKLMQSGVILVRWEAGALAPLRWLVAGGSRCGAWCCWCVVLAGSPACAAQPLYLPVELLHSLLASLPTP